MLLLIFIIYQILCYLAFNGEATMYMKDNGRKSTKEETLILHALMGEALSALQHLEDCLSVSITIKGEAKHSGATSKAEADIIRKKYRKFTLGRAIKSTAKMNLYTDSLQESLEAFLAERNLFVHGCIDNIYKSTDWKILFQRITTIITRARQLQQLLESDLIIYSKSIGRDMSRVEKKIKRWTAENTS